tara:strand:- start:5411 stop:6763 length:1353 start_codon:yes stop_codon:yes gene_type:complete
MTDSNLVTTAKSTGGTSFDTATCISGKCYYPLQEYGVYAKIYEHTMMQTQNKYDPPELNTNLKTYDATNAPLGSKPTRSPFDDDTGAFFVGDTSVNNIGNGLIGFTRLYANIPSEHSEPYGLYSRMLPSIGTESVVLDSTEIANVNLSIEWRYSDGEYYQSRESGNQTDFNNTADTYSQSDSYYPTNAVLNTDSNKQSNWRNYEAVRAKVVFQYTHSTQDLFAGATVSIAGTYSWSQNSNLYVNNSISGSGTALMKVCLRGRYSWRPFNSERRYEWRYLSIGDTFTITDVTENNGVQTVTAYTSPYDLGNLISNLENDSSYAQYYSLFDYKGYCGEPYDYLYNSYSNLKYNIASHTITSRDYVLSGRTSQGELSASAKLKYRYIKTDDPDSLSLNSAYVLPSSITSTSTPNQQEYRDLILNNTYKGAENEYIERYMGNIYRLGQIFTKIV